MSWTLKKKGYFFFANGTANCRLADRIFFKLINDKQENCFKQKLTRYEDLNVDKQKEKSENNKILKTFSHTFFYNLSMKTDRNIDQGAHFKVKG